MIVRAFWLLLILPLLVVAADPAKAPADLAKKNQQLSQLKFQIQKIENELDRVNKNLSAEQRQLRKVDESIGQVDQTIYRLGQQQKHTQEKLSDLKRYERELSTKLAQESKALAALVRDTYVVTRQNRLKIIFRQNDPDQLARMLKYHRYFNQAQQQKIDVTRSLLHEREVTLQSIEVEASHLAQLVDEQQQNKKQLKQRLRQRKTVVAELKKQLGRESGQLGRLKKEEKQLQALVKMLGKALAPYSSVTGKSFKASKGSLPWPLNGNVSSVNTHVRGVRLARKGLLIAAPMGRNVRTVFDGQVIFSRWLNGYGLIVIVDHGDGYMTLYGHNQSILRSVGDYVKAGDVIAKVGNSGGHDKTGVYFEIRKNSRAESPRRWCVASK